MKFIASASTLLKQLQHIAGVINANTVLPILEDFLFEVGKNKLTVVATDLEQFSRFSREVLLHLPNVKDMHTSFSLGEVKAGGALPLAQLKPPRRAC